MVSISGYLSSDLSASEMPVNGCQSGFPLLSVGRLAWALALAPLGWFLLRKPSSDSPVGCAIKLWPYHKMVILMSGDSSISPFQHFCFGQCVPDGAAFKINILSVVFTIHFYALTFVICNNKHCYGFYAINQWVLR